MTTLKQCSFLAVPKQQTTSRYNMDDDCGDELELETLTREFLLHNGAWQAYFSTSKTLATANAPSSVEAFIEQLLAPPAALDTTWTPSNRFTLVCVVTEDSAGDALAQRIALERSLQYATVDQIVDECVQLSVEAQKQSDATPGLSDREVRRVEQVVHLNASH